jgi:hypothetical protein
MKKSFFYFNAFIIFLFIGLLAKGQANSLNQYDYIGSNHNSLMNSFFSEYTQSRVQNENLSFDGVINYIADNSGINEDGFVNSILTHSVYQSIRNTKLVNLSDKLLQMNVISQKYGTYIHSINSAIENELLLGNASFYNRIISLENDVSSDDQLSDEEKGIFLAVASTARYSAEYWMANYDIISSNYGSIVSGKNGKSVKLPRWLKDLIGADVSGAVGGGAIGAMIGGTATLGTLTLPSWAVGAITGGVGNSITSGVQSLWNWLF